MKKLAAVVMMIAMATFMAAAMASADDHDGRTIRGVYAVTGFNACLGAPNGFDTSFTANPPGALPISSESWEGYYTFMPDGKGTLDVVAHGVGDIPNSGESVSIKWEFRYTVTDDGKITFTEVPGSYIGLWLTGPAAGTGEYLGVTGPWDGVISPDGNHMFVTWGAPLILDLLNVQGDPLQGSNSSAMGRLFCSDCSDASHSPPLDGGFWR